MANWKEINSYSNSSRIEILKTNSLMNLNIQRLWIFHWNQEDLIMRKCVCFEISDLTMKEHETYAQGLSLAINAANEQMEQVWILLCLVLLDEAITWHPYLTKTLRLCNSMSHFFELSLGLCSYVVVFQHITIYV